MVRQVSFQPPRSKTPGAPIAKGLLSVIVLPIVLNNRAQRRYLPDIGLKGRNGLGAKRDKVFLIEIGSFAARCAAVFQIIGRNKARCVDKATSVEDQRQRR